MGVASVVLGLLALAFFWWLPTAALVLGLLAVATGFAGRRRLASGIHEATAPSGQRWSSIGMLLGASAVVATIIFVVVTTD